jgi:hypothetical protein
MSLYVPYYRPYNKHNTNIHAPGEFRTRNPSKRAAEDPLLKLGSACLNYGFFISLFVCKVAYGHSGYL